MPRITAKPRKSRGVERMECCGKVCDERCWEASVRDDQFRRRMSTAGGIRGS